MKKRVAAAKASWQIAQRIRRIQSEGRAALVIVISVRREVAKDPAARALIHESAQRAIDGELDISS